jgi:hypothetical protein
MQSKLQDYERKESKTIMLYPPEEIFSVSSGELIEKQKVQFEFHPSYCSTFKPAFQSLTYMSPSVVT